MSLGPDAAQWHARRRRKRRLGCLLPAGAAAALAAVFAVWHVLWLFDEPRITRNYTAEFNARFEQVPEEDRAWPLFKEAIMEALRVPMPQEVEEFWTPAPNWPQWEQTRAYMEQMQPILALVREAAGRAVFGRLLSDALDPDIALARAVASGRAPEAGVPGPSDNPMLISVILEELTSLRRFAQTLSVDVFIAAEDGDSARAADDLRAMLGLARHSCESQTIIGYLVAIGIESIAMERLAQVLTSEPGLFSPAQLAELQEAFMTIGRPGPAPPEGLTRLRIAWTLERQAFYDVVQRTYSDDGHGDGHLTVQGLRVFQEILDVSGSSRPEVPGLSAVYLAASRRELLEEYDRLMDRMEQAAAARPWNRGDAIAAFDEEVERLRSEPWRRRRYSLIWLLMPSMGNVVRQADLADARRDAAITILALARHRADRGHYPQTLAELVPDYLPALPLDPVDGQVMRYRPTESGCVLYSLGYDADDDFGRPPREPAMALPFRLRNEDVDTDGDWVFFPLPMPVFEFEEE
ncbi:MAG: hypothetical protein Kow0022_09870 [Phycisphaerales bacterium]